MSLVTAGAVLRCSMGLVPGMLNVVPVSRVMGKAPAATIMDRLPVLNVTPFGMCRSPANPTVAAATTAAAGVLTPMPCVPVVPGPWVPGSPLVLIGGMPALNTPSKAFCTWAGVIEVVTPGDPTVLV